ncbi:MAG: pyruvate kinase, partial [Clostridia bacterium]|nr:pyruvate kinase [Clostridia bacterium]
YVFDCLTDLAKHWYSDLMIGNFFKVTCPFLYQLDTIAYFALIRNAHTYSTIAGIRETTQLLLDLYSVDNDLYIHPLKVWKRYSPTMFFPHLMKGQEATSVTASSEAAALFSSVDRSGRQLDYFSKVQEEIELLPQKHKEHKRLLMNMLIGSESRMVDLCDKYFSLKDLQMIASREIGTGRIGGKSVGMLIARKILEVEGADKFAPFMEPHDSYFLGADIFYTYIVENGWWEMRTKQKTPQGYYEHAGELREKLLVGRFPENIQEHFVQMLEYFGQSPIIVRSSSLLEDNFGNAFAGKYDSVFCANQGTPHERFEAFEKAVKFVYASTMNEDALAYRIKRGLFDKDEQMAILVQRVSGDYRHDAFFPHIAGVGNSSNLYVWDSGIDMDAGMLRMVFGLGTRAVGRTVGDYAKIVCLSDPGATPLVDYEDQKKFSQHEVDILSLEQNDLVERPLEQIIDYDIKTDWSLFAGIDQATANRLRELGYTDRKPPYILDFKKLLADTQFPALMKDMLATLSKVYDYPVDIEFTANFTDADTFKVNLVQCRPLQTRGLGKTVTFPELKNPHDCFISTNGDFMGGNIRLPIDYIVYVDTDSYLKQTEQGKYTAARQIGIINAALKEQSVMLVGPGRWGTTTPSLGVPVSFSEINNMSVICEVASVDAGFVPELSYGSHFFQDLVETGIFYVAVFDGNEGVHFNPDYIARKKNVMSEIAQGSEHLDDVVRVYDTKGMQIFSDIVSQRLLCL